MNNRHQQQNSNRLRAILHAMHLASAQVILFAVVLGLVYLLSRFFPIADALSALPGRIAAAGVWGAVLFPLIFAFCNVLLLPAGVLSLGSGYCFGLWWGWTLSLLGTLLGAAAAFWIGRLWARRFIEKYVLHHARWRAVDKAVDREGWSIVILSQLNPLFPTSLLDYLYGVTSIKFLKCMAGVAVGQAPGLFLYAYLGTLGQLGLKILRGENSPQQIEYWFWLGGLALSFILTFSLALIASRIWHEHGIDDAETEKPEPSKLSLQPGMKD